MALYGVNRKFSSARPPARFGHTTKGQTKWLNIFVLSSCLQAI